MIYVSPSVLAADFSRLSQDVSRVEAAGANYLHLDVMDGAFVPNISFGAPVISCLRPHSQLLFDVHLMIEAPERYVKDFVHAGADIITFHYEACKDPVTLIKTLKKEQIRVGIAISPDTPAEVLFPLLSMVDMVLVMTVYPGFGGQKMIPETLEKVRTLRKYAEEKGYKLNFEVDGGINADNVGECTAAGANVIVAGSAVFHAKKVRTVIQRMRDRADECPYVK